ncbi:hypothetical protein LR48_Vigan04g141000 [Vigna angularis]|uniref:Uncharacterized protein n=1 Tax=Phaseolus angularis TaxID=3914 RepID=A0A0L9UF71_PHAAN|nr:hypothetical protein LR48_Vigan04g141000 [Vigna angularis]
MADTRRPHRRAAGASSSRPCVPCLATIDGWISDQEKHAEHVHFWQERRIMADFLLLYGILNNIHIDWPALISDTMLKAKKYHVYHLPYALLISRIMEYKGVHLEGELTQAIQAIDTEIRETTFRQMGFVARGHVIIHKDDDHQDDEHDDMDGHMAEPGGVAPPSEAGPSTMPSSSSFSMEEYFTNFSKQLEDMSLTHQARFDELIEMQQTHEEYVIEKFDDFDTRLGNIENRLNLQPPERPPSLEF